MRLGKTASVEELQVVSRFENLRSTLLSDGYADHLDKPLAYWALPADRRLPLALLGRTLGNILNTPFADLSATPGIGRKKIASLVLLLARAANTDPAELPTDVLSIQDGAQHQADVVGADASADGFDPAAVSEASWAQWRASVVRHGLANESLGRFAPSLQNLTRVVWNTPLGVYTASTLAEIRAMKTHGEKRMGAILEVFYVVHTLVGGMGTHDRLAVRIVPRAIDRVEQWIGRALQQPGVPGRQELFSEFVRAAPGADSHRLAATGLLDGGNPLGRQRTPDERSAGRTHDGAHSRPRLPTAQRDQRHHDRPLADGASPGPRAAREIRCRDRRVRRRPDLRQFHAAVELFYPGSRRGAAGPLERTLDAFDEESELLEVS